MRTMKPCAHCGQNIPWRKPSGRNMSATEYAARRYCSMECKRQALPAHPKPAGPIATQHALDTAEDVADLLGFGLSAESVAARLGRSVAAIEITLRRAGRRDLAREFQRADWRRGRAS